MRVLFAHTKKIMIRMGLKLRFLTLPVDERLLNINCLHRNLKWTQMSELERLTHDGVERKAIKVLYVNQPAKATLHRNTSL